MTTEQKQLLLTTTGELGRATFFAKDNAFAVNIIGESIKNITEVLKIEELNNNKK